MTRAASEQGYRFCDVTRSGQDGRSLEVCETPSPEVTELLVADEGPDFHWWWSEADRKHVTHYLGEVSLAELDRFGDQHEWCRAHELYERRLGLIPTWFPPAVDNEQHFAALRAVRAEFEGMRPGDMVRAPDRRRRRV